MHRRTKVFASLKLYSSEKEQDGEHESEAIKRNKMRTVFVTGKDGLTPHEAAMMLVHEARTLVQVSDSCIIKN